MNTVIKYFRTFIQVLTCFLVTGLQSFNSSAQEMWGFANSNYSGIMGRHVNPAKIVGVPYEWEVNVLAADVFYDNNYIFLPKLSNVSTKTTTDENGTVTNSTTFVEYTSPGSKHAFVNALVLGPGFIRNKNTHAWALHSAIRVVASANGVPSALTQAFKTKFDYSPLHSTVFKDMKLNAAGMAFAEIGGTYGKQIMNRELHWLAWGVTLKGLVAFDGMYLHANVGEYSIPDSSTLAMNHVELDYGHAFGESIGPRGYGASTDLGLMYIHKRNQGAYECGKDADRRKRYQYKIGLSLIDIGYVAFNHEASRIHVNDGTMYWSAIDTAKFNSVEELDQAISTHTGGSKISNSFGMFTPAATSLQLDYCLKPRWYANLSIVQRIPISQREVFRANSITLQPRYETRKLEASVSANMYEYEHVYLGAALRYSIFVIGTDRLSSFFASEVRNMDVFFGFKFNSCMLVRKPKNKGACPMNG